MAQAISSKLIMWHGTKGSDKWSKPALVAASKEANRADQGNTIEANEYLDTKDVLKAKVKLMADMVRQSKLCCAYTGAGLSKSSGIPDYATKASNSVVKTAPKLKSNLDAQPTYAHCALTMMERGGFLKHWVQQNHDGLPQKAGYSQDKINEIHGAWYDPSNPVVQFSGSLRTDLFNWMIEMEKKIDLCLCLGTSLSGMNADRIAETPARKSMKDPNVLGTIIINLQKTRLDDVCSLRIFGKLDEVFAMLCKELGLGEIKPFFYPELKEEVFEVPYNEHGKPDPTVRMTLDLREGKKIFVPIKGASNYKAEGVILRRKEDQSFTVNLDEKGRILSRLLGVWWIFDAIKGTAPYLPVINVDPHIVPYTPPEASSSNTTTTTDTYDAPPMSPAQPMEDDNSEHSSSQIKLVQSHQYTPNDSHNAHKWGLKLDSASEAMVASVCWKLHPTFHPPSVICTEYPFEISRLGWGTFTVNADITLKPEYGARVLHAAHELSFDGGGAEVKNTVVKL